MEAKLFEVGGEPRALVVVHDHLRAGRECGLDPGTPGEAALDRILGEEGGTDHDLRVRGVCATGDGGDDHGPVVDGCGGAVDGDRDRLALPPGSGCGGGHRLHRCAEVVLTMKRRRITGWERLGRRLVET